MCMKYTQCPQMFQMQTWNSFSLRNDAVFYGTVGICDVLWWEVTSVVFLKWFCTILQGTSETAEMWEKEGFP